MNRAIASVLSITAVSLAAGFVACSDGSGGSVDSGSGCKEPPTGLAVPMVRTESGTVAHWALAPGCITVSFDPALSARAADIQTALGAWSSVGCSRLCFAALKSEVVAPGIGDRRLHFELQDPPAPAPGTTSLTSVNIRKSDGVIVSARVTLSSTSGGVPELVRLIGSALGLGNVPATTDSALADRSVRVTPSASDAVTLCALYGQPPLCSD